MRINLLDIPLLASAAAQRRSARSLVSLRCTSQCVPISRFIFACRLKCKRLAGQSNVNFTMFEATRIPKQWLKHSLRHESGHRSDTIILSGLGCERLPSGANPALPAGSGFDAVCARGCALAVCRRAADGAVERIHKFGFLTSVDLMPRKNLSRLVASLDRDHGSLRWT